MWYQLRYSTKNHKMHINTAIGSFKRAWCIFFIPRKNHSEIERDICHYYVLSSSFTRMCVYLYWKCWQTFTTAAVELFTDVIVYLDKFN